MDRLKSRTERCCKKTENNGVYFCEDGALITKFEEPDMKLVDDNINALNALKENTRLSNLSCSHP
jgi:hypothetical protein